ncbi:MAG: sigma-70 family RNA polymerase sigma factor [Bacteroidales bacterium]|nr:sigma-70 family RNA polymerase sigma factor [Bacteroidales bacterium]
MKSRTINIHQDLIEACRKGDRSAQFKIYKLYYKAMYNTCLRIVNDTAEAEDIMQESFLDAFERLESYTGEGTFGSWLKRIVINRSLDFLRKEKDYISLEEEQIDIPDPIEENREEEITSQVNEVREAITRLPDEYRVVMSLFLLEGYDHEEISQVLNISNQLSRTRYSRARQKLLQMLRENNRKKAFSYN